MLITVSAVDLWAEAPFTDGGVGVGTVGAAIFWCAVM